MSDYLSRLVARSFDDAGSMAAVRPRRPSVFEPAMSEPIFEPQHEVAEAVAEEGGRRPHRGLLRADVEADADDAVAGRSTPSKPGPLRPVADAGPALAAPVHRVDVAHHRSSARPDPEPEPSESPRTDGDTEGAASPSPRMRADVRAHVEPLPEPAQESRRRTRPAVPVAAVLTPAAAPDLQPGPRRADSSQPPDRVRSPPVIHVTIGRVEVRAVLPAAQPPRPQPAAQPAGLSLGDYLNGKGRPGGAR